MNPITDELLMAYADGDISKTDRAIVEAYLARDPLGADRLAAFTATGKALADLFERALPGPVPQRLIDALLAPESGDKRGGTVVPFKLPKPRQVLSRVPNWALAACVTSLAIGSGALMVLNQRAAGTDDMFGAVVSADGTKIADTALASVLNTIAMGANAIQTIDGHAASIKPVFTFATAQSRFCRQYEIGRSNAALISGVACRDGQGRWTIEAQEAIASASSAGGQIVPAGKASSESIDALVDQLISGDALGLEDEVSVMKNGWRQPNPPKPDIKN